MPRPKISLEEAARIARNAVNNIVINPNAYNVARELQYKTDKIPMKYIGGSTDKARAEFWKQEPVMQHAVDSIAEAYGISPDALKYRINHEGFTDSMIKQRNKAVKNKNTTPANTSKFRGYNLLHGEFYNPGFELFGLDDVADMINSGKVNLINERWIDSHNENEHGRIVHTANGLDVSDNIGIMAASLKYFNDRARNDYPKLSNDEVNRYGLAYYNLGETGGKKWARSGAKGYNYRRNLSNGGSIHIKPSKRGTFTAAASRHGMGVQAFASKVLANKENYSPAMVKKANFARNASKWN